MTKDVIGYQYSYPLDGISYFTVNFTNLRTTHCEKTTMMNMMKNMHN